MLTREFLESKGFTKRDFANGWYVFNSGYFFLKLFLGENISYCYLFTDESEDGCFFDKINEDKLNIILDFINKFNNAN